jgi:hypothetical protein
MHQDNENRASGADHIKKTLIWIVSVALTAAVTAYITNYMNAARAYVELTEVTMEETISGNNSIHIPDHLRTRIYGHAYIKNLDEDTTLDDRFYKILKKTRERVRLGSKMFLHLEEVIKLLKTQSANRSIDARRKEFLVFFNSKKKESEKLSGYLKQAVVDYHLPEPYNVHPDSKKHFQVDIGNIIVDLSELNFDTLIRQSAPSKDLNRPARLALSVKKSNMTRRLWIYYEQDLMIDIYSQVLAQIKKIDYEAEEIMSEVDDIISMAVKKNIVVRALVTNSGNQPMTVMPMAVLMFSVPVIGNKPHSLVPIRLKSRKSEDRIEVIKGGESAFILFDSIDPVDTLINKHDSMSGKGWMTGTNMKQSRLSKLWEAQTPELSATLRLAQSSPDIKKSPLPISNRLVIGLSAEDAIFNELELQ